MKIKIVGLTALTVFSVSGCVTVSGPMGPADNMEIVPSDKMPERKEPVHVSKYQILTSLEKIENGMTRQQVLEIVGKDMKIGYVKSENALELFDPIIIPNPYREEVFSIGGKDYYASYIITRIEQADGMVSEDELTPLIFEDDILIGRGQDFLFALKNHL
ncbi:MAG: hypothetical protein KC713_05440 [Candidatus Omnitrophica bacterium]|nr:hypothetical protein [Candidatus Omnitrophota bacterium]